MSREVASGTTPLASELVSATLYKPTQGRLVRQLTCLAIWVVIALGSWRLNVWLTGTFSSASWLELGIPTGIGIAGAWLGFRLVNWPRFADFLIAVEAEMAKVSWPGKTELVRASLVVIFTIFFLAITLFVFDAIWQVIFRALGVTV